MIDHDSDLFNDIYNTKNEHNGKQTYYLSLIIWTYCDIFFWVIQNVPL